MLGQCMDNYEYMYTTIDMTLLLLGWFLSCVLMH